MLLIQIDQNESGQRHKHAYDKKEGIRNWNVMKNVNRKNIEGYGQM